MTSLKELDPRTTAVLVMDYQRMLVDNYAPDAAAHLAKVSGFLDRMRTASLPVHYVTVGFRPGYPEVNANNVMFSGVKSGGRFRMGDASAEIPEAIAPKEGEVVVVKHRVSGFAGTDLEMVLKAARVETLVMFGIATSGVVLSTVRAGADLDYRIVVISDLCLDIDKQANEFLLTNILPRQATVTDSETFLK
jgi:nicotinamidase-related amidase